MGKLLKRIPKFSKEVQDKRYQNFINSDLGVHDYGHGIFEVMNFDKKNAYRVVYTDGFVECECMDYRKRCEPLGIACKHIFAVKNFIENPIICDKEILGVH